MINQLREQIYSHLQSIPNLAEINDGIPSRLSGFPSIFFSFDRIESSFLDSNKNERVYYFQIHLFQEVSTLGIKDGERNLCDLLDAIIDCFDRTDLGGLAIKIDAVGGNISSVEIESGPALHGLVVLGIHVPISLY